MRHRHSIVLAAAALLASTVGACADDAGLVDRWYAALLAADRAALSDLLADDVRMELGDVGVVQTKREFLESIDEWKNALAGAAIRHRIEHGGGGATTVIACYDFPGNDMLARETFTVDGNHIKASSQARIANSCEAY